MFALNIFALHNKMLKTVTIYNLNQWLQSYIDERKYKVQALIQSTYLHEVFEIRTKMISGKGVDPAWLIRSAFKNAGIIMNSQVEGNWLYTRFELEKTFYFYPSLKQDILLKGKILSDHQVTTLYSLLARRGKVNCCDIVITPVFWGAFSCGYKIETIQKIDILAFLNRFGLSSIVPIKVNANKNTCFFFVAEKRVSNNFKKRILKANFGKIYG